MPWHLERLVEVVDPKMLGQFDLRDQFEILCTLRDRLREVYEDKGILEAVSKRNYQMTRIHFVVSASDSDEAKLLQVLGEDIEDFFFGVPVVIET